MQVTSKTGTVMLLEPDEAVRAAIAVLLKHNAWQVEAFAEGGDLDERMAQAMPSVVLCESSLPDIGAREVLAHCQQRGIPIVFLGHGREVQNAVDLVRMGASDFLEKPFPQSRLIEVLRELRSGNA